MPRIPQYERNMLNQTDQALVLDMAVWRVVKSGNFDKVEALRNLFDSAFDTFSEVRGLSIKEDVRLRDDLFNLINQYACGNKYEYDGYRKSFFQRHSEEHKTTFDYILKEIIDHINALPNLDTPWSIILKKGANYPFDTLRLYIDFVWHSAIYDANFNPKKSGVISKENIDYWNSSTSILDDKVEPDNAKALIKDWNETTESNLAIGSCIEGFYFDSDESTTIIEGEIAENFHILSLPKEIDEAMFDTTIEWIRARIFKKNIPIETVKDIYANYLPVNLSSQTYKRKVIKNKSMVSMLYVGLFCDRLYETKELKWKRSSSSNKKIETLHDAAESVAELFTNIGFPYEVESVINARKKFIKILNELTIDS